MRKLVVAVVLVMGCGNSDAITVIPKADLATSADGPNDDLTSAVDLRTPSDLAWTDLAGGVDIAEAPDLRVAPPDMACAFQIGQSCNANTQCACTTRATCDITGDSTTRCCLFMGDACTSNTQCCQRGGVGTGLCGGNGKCG